MTPVRIAGPVKIGPNHQVDLTPHLETIAFTSSGYAATFKVAAIVLGDDRYDFEHINTNSVDNVQRSTDSLDFAVDDQPCIRTIDFGLSDKNVLMILSHDPVVEEVHLEFIDILPI